MQNWVRQRGKRSAAGTGPRAAEDKAGGERCMKKWPMGHGSMSREHWKKEKNEANSPRPITAVWSRRRWHVAWDGGRHQARVAAHDKLERGRLGVPGLRVGVVAHARPLFIRPARLGAHAKSKTGRRMIPWRCPSPARG